MENCESRVWLTHLHFSQGKYLIHVFSMIVRRIVGNFKKIATLTIPSQALMKYLSCFARFGTISLKNVKNTHGGLILLVKLQDEACNFKSVTALWVFFTFFRWGTHLYMSLFPSICPSFVRPSRTISQEPYIIWS